MNDGRERTAEEREAARLERERRRARREPEAPLRATPEASERAAPEPPVPPASDPAVAPEAVLEQPLEDWQPDADNGDGAADGLEHEVPAGIRTVSGAERHRFRRERQRPAGRARSRVPRRHSRGGRIASLVAILLAAALIWFLVELFQPFHGAGHGSVIVTIPARSSSSQVGDLLEREGVIASSFFFELRATLAGERSDLRSGRYRLQQDMSYGSVLKILTTPPPPIPTTALTIVEGKSRRQIDALLRSQGIRGSYVAATRHSRLLDPTRYGASRSTPSLEGFLFPSTYDLRKPVTIQALVDKQLLTFKQQFSRVNLGYARRHRLTAYDVLIVASIIEKEAATAHDRPLVASVIYNRLKAHMPLGMDSTTRYEFNDYVHPLTSFELTARSPYNTRLNLSLPPTPIGNPGLAAIEAAANPASTNYYYFVVKPCGNGSSVFSSDYKQFLRDSARYQVARARRAGRSPSNC